jgi:NitT/TauT family transport system substrate-binding protein
MLNNQSRRDFLASASWAAVGAASLVGARGSLAAEGSLETTTIRLIFDPVTPVLCFAPQYVAEQFLRIEGFTDVRYVPCGAEGSQAKTLVAGEADITAELCADWVVAIDRGHAIVVLSGLHAGCIEIFASDQVHTIRDLKGKRVAVTAMDNSEHIFLSSAAGYIGLDPRRDIEWVLSNPNDWSRLLGEGEVDAVFTSPPMSYDIHAKQIGHVILNTTTDEPWRHYFCCMVGASRQFVQNYPVATKRALRAILKANQLCSLEPQRTARWLVDRGYASNYDYAQQTLQDVPYQAWRSYDPEDSVRFFSLRLRETGLIEHTPHEIIAEGTDWRFLNELKRELKA